MRGTGMAALPSCSINKLKLQISVRFHLILWSQSCSHSVITCNIFAFMVCTQGMTEQFSHVWIKYFFNRWVQQVTYYPQHKKGKNTDRDSSKGPWTFLWFLEQQQVADMSYWTTAFIVSTSTLCCAQMWHAGINHTGISPHPFAWLSRLQYHNSRG